MDPIDSTNKKKVDDKKNSYSCPELIEYGSLEELTLTGGSGSSDFLGMQDGMGN